MFICMCFCTIPSTGHTSLSTALVEDCKKQKAEVVWTCQLINLYSAQRCPTGKCGGVREEKEAPGKVYIATSQTGPVSRIEFASESSLYCPIVGLGTFT